MKKRDITAAVAMIIVLFLFIAAVYIFLNYNRYEKYTPLSANGTLAVVDGKIVNQDGCRFDLKGISTMSIGWQPEFVNEDAFRCARDKWGVNTIRIPITTSGEYGYCKEDNREQIKSTLEKGIDAATKLGMYVIVDWHTLYEKNPNRYLVEAEELFGYISEKYADADNILYEICNEPNGVGGSWKNVKKYSEQIIPIIRGNDSDAIIIVGTPEFSSDLKTAMQSPIENTDNLLYAYHFYAGSHRVLRREAFMEVADSGLPIIVTEFSVSTYESDGTDEPAVVSADHWAKLMDDYGIGKVFFSLSNEDETNAVIRTDCDKKGSWSKNDLTEAGQWMVDYYSDYTREYLKRIGETTKEAGLSSKENVNAVAVLDSYWSDEKNYVSFYRTTITNGDVADLDNWKLVITFDDDYELTDSWSGTYETDGRQLVITACEWNGTIKAGETAELGFKVEGQDLSYILDMELSTY